MLEITQELYEGCTETRVYPFLDEGANERDLAFMGYVRVLFEQGKQPRIFANIQLSQLTVEDVRKFQATLDRVVKLANGE